MRAIAKEKGLPRAQSPAGRTPKPRIGAETAETKHNRAAFHAYRLVARAPDRAPAQHHRRRGSAANQRGGRPATGATKAGAHTRALTAPRPIRPISICCLLTHLRQCDL